MDLGILISNVDDEHKTEFKEKILSNLGHDYDFYKNLINTYGKNNGSINKTADELFMHKNSIQYRLNKLYEITGYNPRNLDDYVILRLSFILD